MLRLAVALSTVVWSTSLVRACNQGYVLSDQTRYYVTSFSYLGSGVESGNQLVAVVSPNSKAFIRVEGQGPAKFTATLSGGHVVSAHVPDVCGASQIIVFEGAGATRMNIQ